MLMGYLSNENDYAVCDKGDDDYYIIYGLQMVELLREILR